MFRVVLTLLSGAFCANVMALRVVSLSPQATEIVFQLEKEKALVAVSQASDYPLAAKALPRIGSVFMPGVEALARFQPDWVVSDEQTSNPLVSRALSAMRISEFRFGIKTVEDLFLQSRKFLLEVFGEKSSAPLERYGSCVRKVFSRNEPFSFLAFAWISPPIMFGHQTFLSDFITRVGGKNLLPDTWEHAYPQVAQEWLLKRPPGVVFYLEDESGASKAGLASIERWWPKKKIRIVGLPAEKFGRASFTPFFNLKAILPNLVVEPCREG